MMKLLLFILPMVMGELQLGAIIHPKGQLIQVDDKVLVTMSYKESQELPELLNQLSLQLITIKRQIESVEVESSNEGNMKQLTFIVAIQASIEQSQSLLKVSSRRQRGGSVNDLGHVSKFLFGAATTDDIEEIKLNVINLAAVVNSNAKIVQSQVLYNRKQTETLNLIVDHLNEVKHNLTGKLNDVQDYLYMNLFLGSVCIQASQLYTTIKEHLSALISSINGILSINLISPIELQDILSQVHLKFNLLPLYSRDRLYDYYKVIQIFFYHGVVVLQIPFSKSGGLDLFFMTPFPSLVNHTVVVWDHPEIFFTFSSITLKSLILFPDVLDACTHLNNLYVCDANTLIWDHTSQQKSCILQTLLSSDVRFSSCTYARVSSFGRRMYREGEFTYIFQQEKTDAVIKCGNTSERIQVVGTVKFHSTCSIYASTFHVNGLQLHQMEYDKKMDHYQLVPDFGPLIPQKVAEKIKKLDSPTNEKLMVEFLTWKNLVWFNVVNVVLILIGITGCAVILVKFKNPKPLVTRHVTESP